MQRIFSFGKVDVQHRGKRTNPVTVEVELKDTEMGKEFTASAFVWNDYHKTDVIMGGQCLDKLSKLIEDDTFQLILDMWRKHHLNTMHAGTAEQEEAIKSAQKSGRLKDHHYKEECDYLKEIGLYEVEYNGEMYRYGTTWLYREIPKEDLDKIESLFTE